jgi:hypothetical protein
MRYRTFLLIVLLALSGVFLLDMRHYIKTALLFLPFLPVMLSAQPRAVDPTARYHRLICLVHLTGSGKHADPIRPEYMPFTAASGRDGILAWAFQPADDKNMAIIQVVAANRHAFDAILADRRPEIMVFEIGKTSRGASRTERRW